MTTRITTVSVGVEGGKVEDIVYISGEQWCGSGGCTLLILESDGAGFKLLGQVTVVQVPIVLLASKTHGHPDIGVTVRGGGIQAAFMVVLSFNGVSYPENPSLLPARRIKPNEGKIVVANAEGSVPFYN